MVVHFWWMLVVGWFYTISTFKKPSRTLNFHLMDGVFSQHQPSFKKIYPKEHRYIAATHGAHIQVWRTPNHLVREFAPFVLHRTYTGHHDDVLSIQWSPDSKWVSIRIVLSCSIEWITIQVFYHNVSRYDCSSFYAGSSRGIQAKNFCWSPRCCNGSLFFLGCWNGKFSPFSFSGLNQQA